MMQPLSRLLLAVALTIAAVGCGRGEGPRSVAPYVPSPEGVVADLLNLADVGPDDFVIDLGSGDGRIVITAAKLYGASGLGVEIEPDLVAQANASAREQGVADRVSFVQQDLFETDLTSATVVTMYLLPEAVNALKDKLVHELEPGSRVLSHDYAIDGWHTAKFLQLDYADKVTATGVTRTNLYLYVVPAPIAGRWRVSLPAHTDLDDLILEIEQDVTLLRGQAVTDDAGFDLIAKPLHGRQLELRIPRLDATLTGLVGPDTIAGTVKIGDHDGRWHAQREESGSD
jgi:SAM-dependent methyltransferase